MKTPTLDQPHYRLAPHEFVDLEELIDAKGLAAVLEAISQICSEKAEHIKATWQDKELFRAWFKTAQDINRCAGRAEKAI